MYQPVIRWGDDRAKEDVVLLVVVLLLISAMVWLAPKAWGWLDGPPSTPTPACYYEDQVLIVMGDGNHPTYPQGTYACVDMDDLHDTKEP